MFIARGKIWIPRIRPCAVYAISLLKCGPRKEVILQVLTVHSEETFSLLSSSRTVIGNPSIHWHVCILV